MKHGHTVRIATHGEFEKWIVGHGIEFGKLSGNPADLLVFFFFLFFLFFFFSYRNILSLGVNDSIYITKSCIY